MAETRSLFARPIHLIAVLWFLLHIPTTLLIDIQSSAIPWLRTSVSKQLRAALRVAPLQFFGGMMSDPCLLPHMHSFAGAYC